MDTIARVVVIYLFLLVAMRVVGKREFGQLGPFDLVVLLLIPEMLTDALTTGDPSLTNGLIGVGTLLTLVFLTSLLAYRFKAAGRVIEGSPTVLVQHGVLVPKHLDRERVTPDEVLAAMHESGLERMEQVKWAILGTDGRISVVPRERFGQQRSDREARVG
jgi:uncharacterized membrane protein YcaP (DUF421 family)